MIVCYNSRLESDMRIAVMDDKTSVRKQIIQVCKTITPADKQAKETEVLASIMPLINAAKSICVYRAYLWELDLTKIITYCLQQNKSLYQPVAYKHTSLMGLSSYVKDKTNVFELMPGELNNEIQWYNVDLILLPLVAVDHLGHRLGKGGGYYDYTLADIRNHVKTPILCGVGFACQKVHVIPYDYWDIKLDYFVSEQGITRF